MLVFIWREDDNGGFTIDGALIFAYSAANAQLRYHVRALDGTLTTLSAAPALPIKADGFLGQGAHLLAHIAFNIISPGDAALPVNDGHADYAALFLFQR